MLLDGMAGSGHDLKSVDQRAQEVLYSPARHGRAKAGALVTAECRRTPSFIRAWGIVIGLPRRPLERGPRFWSRPDFCQGNSARVLGYAPQDYPFPGAGL